MTKYSPPATTVVVILSKEDGFLSISYINQAITTRSGIEGVPLAYETVILQPFYRMTHSLNVDYTKDEMGLGLTLVKNILEKSNGSIRIRNNIDHAFTKEGRPTTIVITELLLPIV